MTTKHLGLLLVALQFSILLVLLWWVVIHWAVAFPGVWTLGVWGLSLAVGTAALMANRPGNFNIQPTPKEGGHLIEHGIYRWIRHPMYTAVLLLAAGCAMFIGTLEVWVLWCVLLAVLYVKSRQEEWMMMAVHPRYASYREGTKRFVPFVF